MFRPSTPRAFLIVVALLAGLLPLLSSTSTSQARPTTTHCAERDKMLRHLAGKFHEKPVGVGVTASGSLVEVLAAGEGGTWTILLTSSRGWSCLMAAGEAWRPLTLPEDAPET